MKKILIILSCITICTHDAGAAVRGENTATRGTNTQTKTTQKNTRSTVSRNAIKTTVSARSVKPVSILSKTTSEKPVSTKKTATRTNAVSRTVQKQNVVARAAQNETKTGQIYEQCKTALFTCMDQFCTLKNDKFRRCSCSDRIYDFQDISDTYQKVSERLTEFSEDLDVVGMTTEQAIAMKTASAGEDALTEDKSASKQLLQAIMNAINGGTDTKVGGKYEQLNSIIVSDDISNAFGMDDSGQIITSYNGTTLYKAVYPKCREAVSEDCNSASLQRAINAYLMAIEQDCNTVETALKSQQKTLKNATHQSSAMLDLARIENHQKHNSDDIAACILNVENSIQSEEVCGARYHKCLDYGQFIDVSTGAPLTGVSDFYKLGQLLTFKDTENIKDQKLSTLSNNRNFINFFESKTKKFATDALDKCSDKSADVWQQYLDRALLDIYYAQQDKVKEIQDSCFSLVAACYENQTASIENAMANLTGDSKVLLQPATISLSAEMCSDYIESCNNMFDGNIVKKYLANKDSIDNKNACRAVAQQCFDKFGGNGYENFYNPYSGLFAAGQAMDWFSLYDENGKILSPCAKELYATEGCQDYVEAAFGGFDRHIDSEGTSFSYSSDLTEDRKIRPNGIATEVYYKILDNLSTQCDAVKGYFVEYKQAKEYDYNMDNLCEIDTKTPTSVFYKNYRSQLTLDYWYHFKSYENMCPADYALKADTQSWGMCSCWENGGYRSKNGTTKTCLPVLPIKEDTQDSDPECSASLIKSYSASFDGWCLQKIISSYGQICPTMGTTVTNNVILCLSEQEKKYQSIITEKVPHHKYPVTAASEE